VAEHDGHAHWTADAVADGLAEEWVERGGGHLPAVGIAFNLTVEAAHVAAHEAA
jgi:hypothetical protein